MAAAASTKLTHFVTREYQRDLVASIIERALSPRRLYDNIAGIAPTGAGKSFMAAILSIAALRISNPGKNADIDPHVWRHDLHGRQILFIVDQKNLIRQTAKEFKQVIKSRIRYDGRTAERGLEDSITIIQGSNTYEPWKSIVIASRQTLTNCYEDLVDKGMLRPYIIIFDECHSTQFCETGRAIKNYMVPKGGGTWGYPYHARIGLTATPYYHDPDWFGMDWDQAVVSISHGELIKIGALVPYRYFRYGGLELQEGLKANKYGKFREKDAHLKFGSDHRIEFALDEWERITKKSRFEKAIVFPISIAHGERVVEIANSRGHNFKLITHKTPDKERETIVETYKETLSINGLVAVRALQKGFDAKCVTSIIDLAPTKSDTAHIQKLGRGARPFKGNHVLPPLDHCKIFDFVGNISSQDLKGLGQPDLIVLNEKIVLGKEPLPRTYTSEAPTKMCTVCGLPNFTSATVCKGMPNDKGVIEEPGCGAEFLFKDPDPETVLKGRMIEVISPSTVNNDARAISYFHSLRSSAFLIGHNPDKAAHEYRENVVLHEEFPLPRYKKFDDPLYDCDNGPVTKEEKQEYRKWCAGAIMHNPDSDEMAELMLSMIKEKDKTKWTAGLINRTLKLEFTDEVFERHRVEDVLAPGQAGKDAQKRQEDKAVSDLLTSVLKKKGQTIMMTKSKDGKITCDAN